MKVKSLIVFSIIIFLYSSKLQAQVLESNPKEPKVSFREKKVKKTVGSKQVLPVNQDSVVSISELPISTAPIQINVSLLNTKGAYSMDSTKIQSTQPVRLKTEPSGNWKKIHTSESKKQ